MVGSRRIVRLLGEGATGTVYLATDASDRPCAVKLLRRDSGLSEVVIGRFTHEVRAMQAVTDRHLVPLLEVDAWNELPYLVMPHYPRGSLRDELACSGWLAVARMIEVITAVAAGLQALHDAGIVHRDVKPSNVLIDESGDARLGDLGLARAVDWTHVTGPGQAVGTMDHLAPELLRGGPATPSSDIYALGCLAYACCTGGPPFGDLPLASALRTRLTQNPDDPTLLRPDLRPDIAWAVMRALAKEPAERPATPVALARLVWRAGRS